MGLVVGIFSVSGDEMAVEYDSLDTNEAAGDRGVGRGLLRWISVTVARMT